MQQDRRVLVLVFSGSAETQAKIYEITPEFFETAGRQIRDRAGTASFSGRSFFAFSSLFLRYLFAIPSLFVRFCSLFVRFGFAIPSLRLRKLYPQPPDLFNPDFGGLRRVSKKLRTKGEEMQGMIRSCLGAVCPQIPGRSSIQLVKFCQTVPNRAKLCQILANMGFLDMFVLLNPLKEKMMKRISNGGNGA